MRIQGVVFDVDDTLYDMAQPFYAALRRLYGERSEFDLPSLFLSFRRHSDERFEESQTGKISMEQFYIYRIQKTLEEADVQTTDAQALAFQRVYMGLQYQIRLSPMMIRMFNELRSRAKLGVITNGESAHQRKKIASLGLSKWMPEETTIVSGDHKFRKPDPRIFQLMDEPDEANDATEVLEGDLTGQVSFKHVDFQYVADKPLIRDFNLEVNPGEMVAIVGPTGAGKSTIINLLMRFYDVTAGSISVDGHDIRNLSRQDYRKQFGMVLQDAWLFEGTIKENLRFGNLEATDEEIVEAAKAANVDHFIRTLPGGYNMEMNQESSNISLGQKQLLTIARALLADPKILILDEATSSVDTRLELLIQKAMKTLMQGRTSFVIAHRLSTIQEADKILVLKDGQIIEQGNHESLLADKGFYYDLYNSQFAEK